MNKAVAILLKLMKIWFYIKLYCYQFLLSATKIYFRVFGKYILDVGAMLGVPTVRAAVTKDKKDIRKQIQILMILEWDIQRQGFSLGILKYFGYENLKFMSIDNGQIIVVKFITNKRKIIIHTEKGKASRDILFNFVNLKPN